jgi:hypothetical protein
MIVSSTLICSFPVTSLLEAADRDSQQEGSDRVVSLFPTLPPELSSFDGTSYWTASVSRCLQRRCSSWREMNFDDEIQTEVNIEELKGQQEGRAKNRRI